MIMTANELRGYITSDETDAMLSARLEAVEAMIRAYTNNNFQKRAFRAVAVAMEEGSAFLVNAAVPFAVGDTLEVGESELMQGELVTVRAVEDGVITVNEPIYNESGVVLTKVVYPSDVKLGVVELIRWGMDNAGRVGVASETISRHSVTYFNLDGDNSVMGYPRSLLGFLRPYKRARFGQGLDL